jgi:hypothetical protein
MQLLDAALLIAAGYATAWLVRHELAVRRFRARVR